MSTQKTGTALNTIHICKDQIAVKLRSNKKGNRKHKRSLKEPIENYTKFQNCTHQHSDNDMCQ